MKSIHAIAIVIKELIAGGDDLRKARGRSKKSFSLTTKN